MPRVSCIKGLIAAPTVAILMQACAAGGPGGLLTPGSLPSVTSYQEANAVAPQGYQVSSGSSGGDTVRVKATGSASTPNERLLKIALARAAQYGAEEHKKSFKTGEPAYSTHCGQTSVTERGVKRAINPTDYRVVEVDVTYARTADAADPASRPSKETAASLLAELQTETIPPETQAGLVAQLAQACGRTPQ